MSEKILIYNPGGTSTKVAVYEGDRELLKETIMRAPGTEKQAASQWDQLDVWRSDLLNWLKEKDESIESFDMLVAMCGLTRPANAGLYWLEAEILSDMRSEKYGIHPSNPGCWMIAELGKAYGIPAITTDPSNSEEMLPIAFYSGHPGIVRQCAYHVLNHRMVGHKVASEKIGKRFEESHLIIAHMGSGITISAYAEGRVVDVNNGIEGDGPFTTVRSGAVPVGQLVNICFSGDCTAKDVHKQLNGDGGLMGYLGTTDGKEIEARIQAGDQKAKEAVEAMAFQTAKEIGARFVALKGRADAIAITGGLANWRRLTDNITDWVSFIAPVYVYPGENELEAMAVGALRGLRGEEKIKHFGKDE